MALQGPNKGITMNGKGSTGDAIRTVAIASVLVAFGTTIFLETTELQVAKPRTLSGATPVTLSQLPPNISGATIPHNFMESIDCGLPIPQITQFLDYGDANEVVPTGNSTCVRFYPERFFQTVAKPFQKQYIYSKQVKTEHPVIHMTLQHNLNAQVHATRPKYPETLTYFHIRKCGGTTMFRSLRTKSVQHHYKVNHYNRMMIDKMGVVKEIYNQQQQKTAGDTAVVFSFVRDPVIRFLSSVGQMLHMGKVKQFSDCQDQRDLLHKISLESNSTIAKSQALVHCMLQSMKPAGNNTNTAMAPNFDYIDQHMLPQAFELRARALEYDVGIQLMGMERIAPTLKTLVGASKQNRHARSSRAGDYAHGYFLEPSILNEGMIQDICHMYKVDVLLLRRTGVASTLCDGSAKQDG